MHELESCEEWRKEWMKECTKVFSDRLHFERKGNHRINKIAHIGECVDNSLVGCLRKKKKEDGV